MDQANLIDRRHALKLLGIGLTGSLLLTPEEAEAVKIIDVRSPKRRTRPRRKSTQFIILHTTEASGSSSLNSLTRGGKANYVIDTNGKVYRIMNPHQVSVGCGRSMWNGLANLDNHAVNIEVVGFHNRNPTYGQYASLKDLLTDIQKNYRVRDDRVMPHSQVAYGRPNRYHRRSHRERKRCGMLFATEKVRERLGLTSEAEYDPDVNRGRLAVADPYLAEVIYGDSRGFEPEIIAKRETPAVAETEDEDIAIRTVEKGQTAWRYAGDEYANATTIYLLPDGTIRRGDELYEQSFGFDAVQPGTRIAVGYMYGGHVHRNRTAYRIAGRDWNRPDTLYIFDGNIVTGDDISSRRIPDGTLVLFRK